MHCINSGKPSSLFNLILNSILTDTLDTFEIDTFEIFISIIYIKEPWPIEKLTLRNIVL